MKGIEYYLFNILDNIMSNIFNIIFRMLWCPHWKNQNPDSCHAQKISIYILLYIIQNIHVQYISYTLHKPIYEIQDFKTPWRAY